MHQLSSILKPENDLVGDKIAAPIIGLSNFKTLSNWRASGKHKDLPYLKIGRSIRYRVGDLLDFRARHTVGGVKESSQSGETCSFENHA